VAVSGTNVIIGAPEANSGGAAYIYTESDGVWPSTPTTVLPAPISNGGSGFGYSLALSGTTAIIGSGDNAAYIYSDSNGVWPTTPTASLADPFSLQQDRFGEWAVAISGNTALVGADEYDGGIGGAVYVYTESNNVWPTTPTVTVTDPDPHDTNDCFAASLAVSGSTALVGTGCPTSGSTVVYGFTATPTGWQTTPSFTLHDPNPSADDSFGLTLALSGNTAVIGASGGRGQVYGYTSSSPGVWTRDPGLSPNVPNQGLGTGVAVSGSTIIAGAPASPSGKQALGAAFIF
jgi:hypothetical protein